MKKGTKKRELEKKISNGECCLVNKEVFKTLSGQEKNKIIKMLLKLNK